MIESRRDFIESVAISIALLLETILAIVGVIVAVFTKDRALVIVGVTVLLIALGCLITFILHAIKLWHVINGTTKEKKNTK